MSIIVSDPIQANLNLNSLYMTKLKHFIFFWAGNESHSKYVFITAAQQEDASVTILIRSHWTVAKATTFEFSSVFFLTTNVPHCAVNVV